MVYMKIEGAKNKIIDIKILKKSSLAVCHMFN